MNSVEQEKTMGSSTGHILTLSNSIIGVSVLAMPYCFKQCGILLSVLTLISSSLLTRLACHYLMKSAIMERMKNFEMLAFRAFGPHGKLTVEICIIGFMLGTCVAYFVIMGDLGPTIIGPALGLEHVSALRPSVLIGVAIFVVLPIGLQRNVDSLNGLCAASIAFYLVLVLKVMAESAGTLLIGAWTDKVDWWRPAGLLQCLPIFSMALSCQTQLFEIFGSLPNTPLERANAVVKSAVNLTTMFYLSVGFFGYVAYCAQNLTGNLMLNFSPTITSEVIKMGFILTVAVSFPLVIFPCRASIYSLLNSKSALHTHHSHEPLGSAHIPETQFQCITLLIVTGSLIIGLLIPNIEIVLGLVGSTIGVFVCLITPGLIFISLSSKKNNERLMAQFLIGFGLVIMVLGTYANLYATEETLSGPDIKKFEPIVNQHEKAPVPMLNVKDLIKNELDAKNTNILEKESFEKKMEKVVKEVAPVVIEKQLVEPQKMAENKPDKEMPSVEVLKASPKNKSGQIKQPDLVLESKKDSLIAPAIQPVNDKRNVEDPRKNEQPPETILGPVVKSEPIKSPVKQEPERQPEKSEMAKAVEEPKKTRDDSVKAAGAQLDDFLPRLSNRSKLNNIIQNKLTQKMADNVPLPLALAQLMKTANESKQKAPVLPPQPQPMEEAAPKSVAAAIDSPAQPQEPIPQSKLADELPGVPRQPPPAEQPPVNNREILEIREKRDTDACDKNEKDNKAETSTTSPTQGGHVSPTPATIIKTPRTLSNGDEAELLINPETVERTLVAVAGDASSHLQGAASAVSQDQPHKRDLKSLEKQN